MGRGSSQKQNRPDIFSYDHYRSFFKDYLAYLKVSEPGFSLRNLSQRTGVSPTYFSYIVSGKVKLSEKILARMIDHLGLHDKEKNYLRQMRLVVDSTSASERAASLRGILRFKDYKKRNFNEAEVSRYLSEWYYIAIKHLSRTEGFKLDPKWIQKRLVWRISPEQIQEALDFLIDHKYIVVNRKGKVTAEGRKVVERESKIYQAAMAKYHKDMLELAAESILDVEREKRQLDGYTFSISEEKFSEVQSILDETLQKLTRVEDSSQKRDSVYQVTLSSFPLARSPGKKKEVKR